MKRIAILTSGGDYAGLHAVIGAVMHRAVDVPMANAVAGYHALDPDGPRVRTARGRGIRLGDR